MKIIEETDKSIRYLLDFSKAKVQLFEFKKGYKSPKHKHEGNALHIITKGKIQLDSGEIITASADYKCGGWEYRLETLEDTQIILIEENI